MAQATLAQQLATLDCQWVPGSASEHILSKRAHNCTRKAGKYGFSAPTCTLCFLTKSTSCEAACLRCASPAGGCGYTTPVSSTFPAKPEGARASTQRALYSCRLGLCKKRLPTVKQRRREPWMLALSSRPPKHVLRKMDNTAHAKGVQWATGHPAAAAAARTGTLRMAPCKCSSLACGVADCQLAAGAEGGIHSQHHNPRHGRLQQPAHRAMKRAHYEGQRSQ
jgi:hypothetical protein